MAYEIVQTAEIIEKNGLFFQVFWRYTRVLREWGGPSYGRHQG